MDKGGSRVSLSLKRLCGEGLGRGGGEGSFTGDPARYVKKVSEYGHFFPYRPLSGRREPGIWKGAHTPGTLKI